jgi:hypothetical protein
MRNIEKIIVIFAIILSIFLAGCTQEKNDVDTHVGEGTLKLKITDKPATLDILHANVTISSVIVHKAVANESENAEGDSSEDEIENIDDYNDSFIANGNGPYYGDPAEDIIFYGNATGGDSHYNWSWDFGDGNISYEQNATHNYSLNGEYTVNLTVTDDNGSGLVDWYITTAFIGEIEDDNDSLQAEWVTIVNESQEFDLIQLQNVTDILGEKELSVGKYTQIRLTVEQAKITINNSGEIEVHDMKIPSKTVKLVKAFWINENETTELTLDFDVMESVHQTGNNKFMMRPTIKIIEG